MGNKHLAALAASAVVCIFTLSGCQPSPLNGTSSTTDSTDSGSTSSSGNSYYVSSTGSDSTGTGTISNPWATIAHASTKVSAGATVYVAAGVYTASFTTSSSGTSSSYITYQASAADFSSNVNCAQVAANHGNLGTCAQLVGTDTDTWVNNGNYVAIQGFDVTGPGINGIYTQGNATIIQGNHVHDVMPSTCNDNGGSGINLNGTNAQVVSNYVHNIGPYPSSCGYVQGIYFLQAGGYAYNNISFNNSGFGIQMWHYPANLAIFNNTIFANASGGIVLGTDDSGVNVNNIVVANNIVMDNTNGPGISEQGTTGHNTFENNLLYGNSDGAFSLQNGDAATGTVTTNPQFVGYTGNSSGNYQLQSGSSAIGAGLSSGAPSTDFLGVIRTAPITLGAYQGTSGSSSSTSPAVTASGVTVSSPANGSTVTSPFSLVASATTCSGQKVVSMGYSFGYGSTTIVYAQSIQTSVTPPATGAEVLHVKAWGSSGASCVTTVNFTANQATSGSSPSTSPASTVNGVTVTSPSNGATVASPFSLVASATTCSGQKVVSMGYSFGNASTTIVRAQSIQTSVTPPAKGAEVLHVKAWGSSGASCVNTINFNAN